MNLILALTSLTYKMKQVHYGVFWISSDSKIQWLLKLGGGSEGEVGRGQGQPFGCNCRPHLNTSRKASHQREQGKNINVKTHSFLALQGFQIVSNFNPLSEGQRGACGQLGDKSSSTHNTLLVVSAWGAWALHASSSWAVNLAPATSIWFIIKTFNYSKMSWQKVQREGINGTGEMEKAVCREAFCLAWNPINIFRGKPNSMSSFTINSTLILLVKLSSQVNNLLIVLASQFSKIVRCGDLD